MNMSNNELVLVCSEIGTREYLPKELIEKKIRDIADWLWKKYDEDIGTFLGGLSGLEGSDKRDNRHRAPILFEYVDLSGKMVPIDPTDDVRDISQMTDQIYWHPDVIGGQRFRQIFGNHAKELIGKKKYGNWEVIRDGEPGYGIIAVGPDPQGIIRTWKIRPSDDYPNTPPIVTSEPPFTNDICWSGGILHYTGFYQRGGSPWTKLVQRSTNPLHALMIELLQKYKFGV